MRYGCLLAAALFASLSGCGAGNNPTISDEGAPASPQVNGASQEATCPYADFDSFISDFSEKIGLQRTSIMLPLKIQSLDPAAEPEPTLVATEISGTQIELPVFPSRAQQLAEGLETRQSTADGEVMVTIFKADTDYQKSYFFRKDPCWKLVRIRDDSL